MTRMKVWMWHAGFRGRDAPSRQNRRPGHAASPLREEGVNVGLVPLGKSTPGAGVVVSNAFEVEDELRSGTPTTAWRRLV
jgi:hypothetical protein